MSRSVRDGFEVLKGWMQPTTTEMRAATSHEGSIKRALRNAFGVDSFKRMGSHMRGTSVSGRSDVDYLAVMPTEVVRRGSGLVRSDGFIRKVREALDGSFPRTDVNVDQNAVTIHFGAGEEPVDVVPAVFQSDLSITVDGKWRPTYEIPDGDGGWIPTNPEAHALYFAAQDATSGGRLKYVVQMLKYWKYARSTPLPVSSFYLEMRLASSEVEMVAQSYSRILLNAFGHLMRTECRPVRDPVKIARDIPAASTAAKLSTVQTAVLNAVDHAAKAVIAEAQGDLDEAYFQWDLVFNRQFPGRH